MVDKTPCGISAISLLTESEIQFLDGLTATTAEVNSVCDGNTATAAEINMAADVSTHVGSYTATSPAAIPATVRVIELAHASTAIEKTIADFTVYANQFVFVKDTSASGTISHTVTITGGTWNGTNTVVTLNAANEAILVYVDSAGDGTIIENVGGVALS